MASSKHIVVLDAFTTNPGDTSWEPIASLGELVTYDRTPPELVVDRCRNADVVITNKTRIGAAELASLPGLRGICVLATGYDVVDVAAARARGIPVCNVPEYSTPSVVEHTFALLFELYRQVGMHAALVREGEWARSADFSFWRTPQLELSGRTLGIVGYGSIGRAVARVALAFGMRVIATRSRRNPPDPGVTAVDVNRVFAEADVVSLHCPLTEATKGLVRWERLVTMKRRAVLLNTARGGLVNEADLARALREGVIAGAAVDVLSSEPPSLDNPLLSAPRIVITPHLAWATPEARGRLIAVTAENVRGILTGSPVHVVNPGATAEG
ncbi:MAG: D-2-hydroxyacid dehydrogenase [Pseudomonadota bacterium]|nr:MAG: glycerate dehydrogenase [Pseudomonadota bacterium]